MPKTADGDLTSINWVNTGTVGLYGNIGNCGSLTNTAYYTDNSNGDPLGGNAAVATTNTNLELDGWTNYLYQPISVIPGQTYHIKAVVADAGDRNWDSAVFFHLIFSTNGFSGFDFGDAPDTYKTLTSNGGPSHGLDPAIFLGNIQPDAEVTGIPSTGANGDDNDSTDDEDGVASFPVLTADATSYTVETVVNNTLGHSATLVGWIDFNINGQFESNEAASVTIPSGSNGSTVTLNWTGLSGLNIGSTYARLRISTDPTLSTATPGGAAANGEVEDYPLEIVATQTASCFTPGMIATHGTETPMTPTVHTTFNRVRSRSTVRIMLPSNPLSSTEPQIT